MVMPRAFSSGALSIWSKATSLLLPSSASTLVMAAVSVVLPGGREMGRSAAVARQACVVRQRRRAEARPVAHHGPRGRWSPHSGGASAARSHRRRPRSHGVPARANAGARCCARVARIGRQVAAAAVVVGRECQGHRLAQSCSLQCSYHGHVASSLSATLWLEPHAASDVHSKPQALDPPCHSHLAVSSV